MGRGTARDSRYLPLAPYADLKTGLASTVGSGRSDGERLHKCMTIRPSARIVSTFMAELYSTTHQTLPSCPHPGLELKQTQGLAHPS